MYLPALKKTELKSLIGSVVFSRITDPKINRSINQSTPLGDTRVKSYDNSIRHDIVERYQHTARMMIRPHSRPQSRIGDLQGSDMGRRTDDNRLARSPKGNKDPALFEPDKVLLHDDGLVTDESGHLFLAMFRSRCCR